MSDESDASSREPAALSAGETTTFWQRIKGHKVLQWGVAYLGAALALAQGQDLLAASFGWPNFVGRIVLIALIAGLPIAVTVAWYHGHRALRQVTAGELGIISVLVLIGGFFFALAFRPSGESAFSVQPVVAAPVPTATGSAGSAGSTPSESDAGRQVRRTARKRAEARGIRGLVRSASHTHAASWAGQVPPR